MKHKPITQTHKKVCQQKNCLDCKHFLLLCVVKKILLEKELFRGKLMRFRNSKKKNKTLFFGDVAKQKFEQRNWRKKKLAKKILQACPFFEREK